MKRKLIIFWIMALAVLLAACSGVEAALQSVDEPIAGEVKDEQGAAATSEPTVYVETAPTATEAELVPTETEAVAENTADESSEEAVVEEMIAPTPRAELFATDPATVSLASGEVQLVELFAYW